MAVDLYNPEPWVSTRAEALAARVDPLIDNARRLREEQEQTKRERILNRAQKFIDQIPATVQAALDAKLKSVSVMTLKPNIDYPYKIGGGKDALKPEQLMGAGAIVFAACARYNPTVKWIVDTERPYTKSGYGFNIVLHL